MWIILIVVILVIIAIIVGKCFANLYQLFHNVVSLFCLACSWLFALVVSRQFALFNANVTLMISSFKVTSEINDF